ncbi:hypothetical protein VPH35_068122 [Triticum aestivum]
MQGSHPKFEHIPTARQPEPRRRSTRNSSETTPLGRYTMPGWRRRGRLTQWVSRDFSQSTVAQDPIRSTAGQIWPEIAAWAVRHHDQLNPSQKQATHPPSLPAAPTKPLRTIPRPTAAKIARSGMGASANSEHCQIWSRRASRSRTTSPRSSPDLTRARSRPHPHRVPPLHATPDAAPATAPRAQGRAHPGQGRPAPAPPWPQSPATEPADLGESHAAAPHIAAPSKHPATAGADEPER